MNKGAVLVGGAIVVAGLIALVSSAKADEPAPSPGGGRRTPPLDPDKQARCDGYFAAKAVLRNQRESAKAYMIDIDAALMAAYVNGEDATALEAAKKTQQAAIDSFNAELAKLDSLIASEDC